MRTTVRFAWFGQPAGGVVSKAGDPLLLHGLREPPRKLPTAGARSVQSFWKPASFPNFAILQMGITSQSKKSVRKPRPGDAFGLYKPSPWH